MAQATVKKTIKPTDLRGILRYVPQFRDHVFVICIDGVIVEDENFNNVITDIAVLISLKIKVVIVHGIGRQLTELCNEKNIPFNDRYGEDATDAKTLELAIQASSIISHKIMRGLTQNGLACLQDNSVRGTPIGVMNGKEFLFTGKVEKVDTVRLLHSLNQDIIPIISPIMFTSDGQPLRASSDALAASVAAALKASKLIYLTNAEGLPVNGSIVYNLPVESLTRILEKEKPAWENSLRVKAMTAAKVLQQGVLRAHIIDGRIFGALLTEIFDKVGVGTMIHANEYQQIRQAKKKDAQAIFNIRRNAVRSDVLRHRTRQSIEQDIEKFYVYEIDESIIGCVSITSFPNSKTVELGSLYVQPFYQGHNVGSKLVEFVCMKAKEMKMNKVIAMSTQTSNFFTSVCAFKEGSTTDLPAPRKKDYLNNGRNSYILVKNISRK